MSGSTPLTAQVIDGLPGTAGEVAADALSRHAHQLDRMTGAVERLAGHDLHLCRPEDVAARLARLTEQYHQLPLVARPVAYLMSLERVYRTIGPRLHPSSFAAAWRRVVRVFASERAI